MPRVVSVKAVQTLRKRIKSKTNYPPETYTLKAMAAVNKPSMMTGGYIFKKSCQFGEKHLGYSVSIWKCNVPKFRKEIY